jgi:hypothetical protein
MNVTIPAGNRSTLTTRRTCPAPVLCVHYEDRDGPA